MLLWRQGCSRIERYGNVDARGNKLIHMGIAANLCLTNQWAKNDASDRVSMHHASIIGFGGIILEPRCTPLDLNRDSRSLVLARNSVADSPNMGLPTKSVSLADLARCSSLFHVLLLIATHVLMVFAVTELDFLRREGCVRRDVGVLGKLPTYSSTLCGRHR